MEERQFHWQTVSSTLWDNLKPLARQMRHEPTTAEKRLWQVIRNRQVANAKFRRQHSIERFIVDFLCVEARLIVEVDGLVHGYTFEEDAVRQEFLESLGFRVIRVTNEDVMKNLEGVVAYIRQALEAVSEKNEEEDSASLSQPNEET